MVWINVKKFKINILKYLVVALQSFDELRLRLHEFLWYQRVNHPLEDQPPFCWVGADVRRT
jgi:hypothetical protein